MLLRNNTQARNKVRNNMSNVKNVEAFGKLTGICTGYGGSYKPGQPNLQVSSMATLLSQARQAIADVIANQTDFDNATNVREVKFAEMQRLCPRIMNALKACGASALTIEDAQASVRKMGSRKSKPSPEASTKKEGDPKEKTRKARGLDFGSLASHFAKLVETVSSEPNYQPNEPELSIEGITAVLIGLRSLNEEVHHATANLNNSRRNREAVLYTKPNSLMATARATKQYIRSAYGVRSVQDKEVSRIRFTKSLK